MNSQKGYFSTFLRDIKGDEIKLFLADKRVLVTGCCGSVGRELTRQLIEKHRVTEFMSWFIYPLFKKIELMIFIQ